MVHRDEDGPVEMGILIFDKDAAVATRSLTFDSSLQKSSHLVDLADRGGRRVIEREERSSKSRHVVL